MTAHAVIALRPHVVYRLYGKRGRLLYIGCTSNLQVRMVDHRHNALFGHNIGRVEISEPMSYIEARRTERLAIAAEQPPFNTEWTRRDPRPRCRSLGPAA